MNDEIEKRIFKERRRQGRTQGKQNLYGEQNQYNETKYFNLYQSQFRHLVVSLIRYKNAPKEFNGLYLEWLLRYLGYATIVVYNGSIFVTASKNTPTFFTNAGYPVNVLSEVSSEVTGKLEPLTLESKPGDNGYITITNKPFLYDSMTNLTDFDMIDYYSAELAQLKMLMLANSNKKINTYIGVINKGDLTALNIVNQLNNKTEYIELNKNVDDINNVLSLQSLNPQDFYPSLNEQFKNSYDEMLKFLGVGVPSEKKERKIVNEVENETEITDINANIYLSSRMEVLDIVNFVTGQNIVPYFNNLRKDGNGEEIKESSEFIDE